ncbi:MAG: hypothetical protein RRZ24_11375 [Clostridia bacterium]
MTGKIGRPTSNPKEAGKVTARLDEKCIQIIDGYCKQHNVGKAEAVRKGIMKLEQDIKNP